MGSDQVLYMKLLQYSEPLNTLNAIHRRALGGAVPERSFLIPKDSHSEFLSVKPILSLCRPRKVWRERVWTHLVSSFLLRLSPATRGQCWLSRSDTWCSMMNDLSVFFCKFGVLASKWLLNLTTNVQGPGSPERCLMKWAQHLRRLSPSSSVNIRAQRVKLPRWQIKAMAERLRTYQSTLVHVMLQKWANDIQVKFKSDDKSE